MLRCRTGYLLHVSLFLFIYFNLILLELHHRHEMNLVTIETVRAMQEEGLSPDVITYTSLIKVHRSYVV